MHGPYDRSRKSNTRSESKGGAGFLVLFAAVAIVLIILATAHPKASVWISQAVQAEFGGGGVALDMPVETAQPGLDVPIRTVNAR